MQTIIGLGQAGCNITDQFSQYPQYKVIKIDAGLKRTKETFGFKSQLTPELYEENVSRNLRNYLRKEVTSETLFITSCGNISGASLAILESIKNNTKISVMYIVPLQEDLFGTKKLQNNLLFNVFQEYARSAVFERVYLLDNQNISDIIGPVPVLKYWKALNKLICTTYHMINVFEHSNPILTTMTSRINTARMSTIGILDTKENEEKMFFSLDIPREKNYYYGVPSKQLEEDPNLMETIRLNLKGNIDHDKMKSTYSVYSTDYDEIVSYCEKSSTLIQKIAP